MTDLLDRLRFDANGLVPVVIQDAESGAVLTLAYANRKALERTLATRQTHLWSRSRQELWQKGAVSGHTQEVIEVRVDCDHDAVLYRVKPAGPACHTGAATCFFAILAPPEDLASLYRRAFEVYGIRALWNMHPVKEPTPAEALAITQALRTHGGMDGRRLAERIEELCRADP